MEEKNREKWAGLILTPLTEEKSYCSISKQIYGYQAMAYEIRRKALKYGFPLSNHKSFNPKYKNSTHNKGAENEA